MNYLFYLLFYVVRRTQTRSLTTCKKVSYPIKGLCFYFDNKTFYYRLTVQNYAKETNSLFHFFYLLFHFLHKKDLE